MYSLWRQQYYSIRWTMYDSLSLFIHIISSRKGIDLVQISCVLLPPLLNITTKYYTRYGLQEEIN